MGFLRVRYLGDDWLQVRKKQTLVR